MVAQNFNHTAAEELGLRIKRSMCARQVLVIGDMITDVYVYGRVDTCQEGCTKFVEERRAVVHGGAVNASLSTTGWMVPSMCVTGPVESANSIKRRYIANGKTVFRHDTDASGKGNYDVSEAARKFLKQYSNEVCAILVSDYNKGALDKVKMENLVSLAVDYRLPIVADAKREPAFYSAAIIKGNAEWAQKYSTNAELLRRTVVTHGADLPTVCGKPVEMYPIPVPCVNHVGAGDCFGAHLALALGYGLSLSDSVRVAYSAARCYVQKPHNTPPKVKDIILDSRAITL